MRHTIGLVTMLALLVIAPVVSVLVTHSQPQAEKQPPAPKPQAVAVAPPERAELEPTEEKVEPLPPGHRACFIRVGENGELPEGVAPPPGSRVDLLWIPKAGERIPKLFLEDVLVVAASCQPSPDAIALWIKKETIPEIVLGKEMGRFAIATRTKQTPPAGSTPPNEVRFLSTWVAKKDLRAGTKLRLPLDLFARKWVRESEADTAAVFSLGPIRDHFLTTDLGEGELVLSQHVSEQLLIPPGHKAVIVRIPHSSEKFDGRELCPGCRVNILWTIKVELVTKAELTLEDVLVLATDCCILRPEYSLSGVISVAVPDKELSRLTLFQELGEVSLKVQKEAAKSWSWDDRPHR